MECARKPTLQGEKAYLIYGFGGSSPRSSGFVALNLLLLALVECGVRAEQEWHGSQEAERGPGPYPDFIISLLPRVTSQDHTPWVPPTRGQGPTHLVPLI